MNFSCIFHFLKKLEILPYYQVYCWVTVRVLRPSVRPSSAAAAAAAVAVCCLLLSPSSLSLRIEG